MGLCPKPCIGNFPQEVSYEPSRTLTKEIFDSCTNLNHFYPVAERGDSLSSRNSQHGKRLHQNQHNKKIGVIIPLVEGLEGS